MVSLHEYVRKVGGASHCLRKVEEPRMYLEMENVINSLWYKPQQAQNGQCWKQSHVFFLARNMHQTEISLISEVGVY